MTGAGSLSRSWDRGRTGGKRPGSRAVLRRVCPAESHRHRVLSQESAGPSETGRCPVEGETAAPGLSPCDLAASVPEGGRLEVLHVPVS